MRKINKILALIVLMFFTAPLVFAADVKSESWIEKMKSKFAKKEVTVQEKADKTKIEAAQLQAKKPRKDMTKEELAAEIIKALDRYESILNVVPGLAKSKGQDGKNIYTYNGSKLTDLDKETLDSIYGRVRNEALIRRMENINRQLDMVRRTQSSAIRVPQPPPSQPRPPAVFTNPSTPNIPQAPKTPSGPPAPPRR